jgi:hypothetical protein
MKVRELINLLDHYDPEMEVCIFDHKYNLKEDYGDGTSAGVYPDFEVAPMTHDAIPEGTPEWLALSFDNSLIDDDTESVDQITENYD